MCVLNGLGNNTFSNRTQPGTMRLVVDMLYILLSMPSWQDDIGLGIHSIPSNISSDHYCSSANIPVMACGHSFEPYYQQLP